MRNKKIMAIVLASVMTLSLFGCSKSEEEPQTDAATETDAHISKTEAAKDQADTVFAEEDFGITGYEGTVELLSAAGDNIYFTTHIYPEDTDIETTSDDQPGLSEGLNEDPVYDSGSDNSYFDAAGDHSDAGGDYSEAAADYSDQGSDEAPGDYSDAAEDHNDAGGDYSDAAGDHSDAGGDYSDNASDFSDQGSEEPVVDFSEAEEDHTMLYKAPLSGGKAELIKEIDSDSDSEYLSKIIPGSDGNIYIDYVTYSVGGIELHRITKLESDGSEEDAFMINDIYSDYPDNYPVSFMVDKEGEGILVMDNKILRIAKDGAVSLIYENEDVSVSAASLTAGGSIALGSIIPGNDDIPKIILVDPKDGSVAGEYKVEDTFIGGSESFMQGSGDFDLYFRTLEGVSAFSVSEGRDMPIFSFSASDIASYSVISLFVIDQDNILVAEMLGTETVIEKYKRDENPSDKKVLTLATVAASYEIMQAVIDFNKSSTDVRINLADYSGDENGAESLAEDIKNGDIPDIMDISCFKDVMTVDSAYSSGLITNLDPFLESDPDISEDDILPSALNAMKSGTGLAFTAPFFTVSTLAVRESFADGMESWDAGEMLKFYDKYEEASLFYSSSKKSSLSYILYDTYDNFVDYDKKETSFDSEEFKNILLLCDKGTDENISDDERAVSDLIQGGDVLVYDTYITQPTDIQINSGMFGGDITYIGYPSQDGKGSYFDFDMGAAITSACEDKDQAWEFVRTFLTEDYQGHNYQYNSGFPSRNDVLDTFFESQSTDEEYTDKYGNLVTPSDWDFYVNDTDTVHIGACTGQDKEMVLSIFDKCGGRVEFSSRVIDIIADEAGKYFEGQAELDETAEIIDKRVCEFLNE